ncbi:acyl-CoA dehydrogenase family protein [Pseudomonas sp. HLS-6]|uniref:acyl-CoA dehydrogenase family protein n=1 Tax=Pseudomonas sp. HLS-6 TaxID=2049589 RepID=UPI0015A894B0|nr:acyl-CoA dehydrogenase family protein [Pseudomonas sp. HLS-6]
MRTVMQWRDLPAEAEEWIARIEAVRPLIRQYRDYAEEQGEAHPKVIAELCKLGFSRLCVSKDFGGQQRDIRVISQIVQRLAALDTSVSWP